MTKRITSERESGHVTRKDGALVRLRLLAFVRCDCIAVRSLARPFWPYGKVPYTLSTLQLKRELRNTLTDFLILVNGIK